MDSEGKTSDTEPLLTREQIPAGPRASIPDHESSALREGVEGGMKTSEPPACAPVTARGGEDLKVRIATSVQQARQLLQQVKQEPESVDDSQGGGGYSDEGSHSRLFAPTTATRAPAGRCSGGWSNSGLR